MYMYMYLYMCMYMYMYMYKKPMIVLPIIDFRVPVTQTSGRMHRLVLVEQLHRRLCPVIESKKTLTKKPVIESKPTAAHRAIAHACSTEGRRDG